MAGCPKYWPTLQRHRCADRQEILNHSWCFIRPVCVEAVIPHPDPPADADPMKRNGNDYRLPCGVEERYHREDVKNHHRDHRDPIDLSLVTEVDMTFSQSLMSPQLGGPVRSGSYLSVLRRKKSWNVIVV